MVSLLILAHSRSDFEPLCGSHTTTCVAISINHSIIILLILVKIPKTHWIILWLMIEPCSSCATMIRSCYTLSVCHAHIVWTSELTRV